MPIWSVYSCQRCQKAGRFSVSQRDEAAVSEHFQPHPALARQDSNFAINHGFPPFLPGQRCADATYDSYISAYA
jgi:hypothetical protein